MTHSRGKRDPLEGELNNRTFLDVDAVFFPWEKTTTQKSFFLRGSGRAVISKRARRNEREANPPSNARGDSFIQSTPKKKKANEIANERFVSQ